MFSLLMGNSFVSVILTCFNQETYLAEALDSVLNQSYPYWECIILNDGSTDRSEEIAMQYVAKDERFVYVYQENQGVVAARNNAIKASKGKYLLPLDGDDILSPKYLELAVDILDRFHDVILVCCDVCKFGDDSGKMLLPEMTRRNILWSGCCVSSSMFRREAFDIIGGYKEDMESGWEDWEFFISLMETDGKVYKLNEVLFYYRILNCSRDRIINDVLREQLRDKIVQLHPNFYHKEYDKLLNDYNAIVKARSYKIYAFLIEMGKKLANLLRVKKEMKVL